MPSWWNSLPLFWRGQIVGWGLFAVIDVVAQQMAYHDMKVALSRSAIVLVGTLVLSAAMRAVYVSQGVARRLTVRAVGAAALMSAAAAALLAGVLLGARELMGWDMPLRSDAAEFLVPLSHYVLAFAGWNLCYFWIHAEMLEQAEHRRAMRAEADALRAELEELRLQLDPHFLFNALNGVAEEIPEHPEAALAMLRDLTSYLRHSLDGIHQTVTTVEAEVAGLAAFLRVQQARFGDRLRVAIHVEPAAGPRPIASFLLQPLVENAVKHGRREDGLDIHIDIASEKEAGGGDALRVEIENTGTLGAGPSPNRRPGIGVENVRRRLELHYPGRHVFTLAGYGPDKVRASLILKGEPCSGS